MMCEAFEISPAEAEEQDELLAWRVIHAQQARRVVRKTKEKGPTQGPKLTEYEAKSFSELLDELDKIDEAKGIPEEI